jgi:dihydrofolate reductase
MVLNSPLIGVQPRTAPHRRGTFFSIPEFWDPMQPRAIMVLSGLSGNSNPKWLLVYPVGGIKSEFINPLI